MLAEQLLALIAEECATRPTILVIDDLQWADRASVRLLARLAGSARDLPLLLAAMMRPVPQRDDLLALRRAGDAARLQLTGLPRPRWPSWWHGWPAACPTAACWSWRATRRATRCTSPSWWRRWSEAPG